MSSRCMTILHTEIAALGDGVRSCILFFYLPVNSLVQGASLSY
jgi:hypothetical protein